MVHVACLALPYVATALIALGWLVANVVLKGMKRDLLSRNSLFSAVVTTLLTVYASVTKNRFRCLLALLLV